VEVRRSLGSSSFSNSRLLALRYGMRVRKAFDAIAKNDLSNEQCVTLLRHCFADLADEVAPYPPLMGKNASLFVEEQAELSREYAHTLECQIEAGHFSQPMASRAAELLGRQGFDLNSASQDQRRFLVEGVARARPRHA